MERVVFEAKAKQQINDISNEIDSLKLKMKTASENLKHQFQEKIDDFEEKRDELQAKYEKLVDIADDEWDDAKESFKTRFARLKEKLKNALD